MKYAVTDNNGDDGLSTLIIPGNAIAVSYISLVGKKYSGDAALELTPEEENLVETYLSSIDTAGMDIKRAIEFSSGTIGVDDLAVPELMELSKLPSMPIKKNGYIKEARIHTFLEDDSNDIRYTNVHYSVVDIRGGEVNPIIVNGVLIVPERLDIAKSFQGSLLHHNLRKGTTLEQLRNFEKEY